MDAGDEPIEDQATAARLRAQAVRVYVEAIVATLLLTALSVLL